MVWSVCSYTKVFQNFNSCYLDAIIATSVIIKCAITLTASCQKFVRIWLPCSQEHAKGLEYSYFSEHSISHYTQNEVQRSTV